MSEDPTQPTLKTILEALNAIRAELREMSEEQRQASARLTSLESKQYDTKPIWERALKEIAETRHEMSEMRREVNSRFDHLGKRINVLAGDVLALRADSEYPAYETPSSEAGGEPEKRRT